MSLSFFDQKGTEVTVKASEDQPIEFFIPRDPNIILPSMELQNVTSKTIEGAFDYQLVDLDRLVGDTGLTVSLHFEIQPLDPSLAYVFVYQFDMISKVDEWSLFCPSSKCSLTSNDFFHQIFPKVHSIPILSIIVVRLVTKRLSSVYGN